MTTLRFMNIAKNESEKSLLRCAHGAIITQGQRIISKGFNHERTRFQHFDYTCGCHAERDAVMKLLSLKGWRKQPWWVLQT